jgi:hypothetical protein
VLLACVEPQTGRLRGILALLLLAYAISLHACLYRLLISSADCPPDAFSLALLASHVATVVKSACLRACLQILWDKHLCVTCIYLFVAYICPCVTCFVWCLLLVLALLRVPCPCCGCLRATNPWLSGIDWPQATFELKRPKRLDVEPGKAGVCCLAICMGTRWKMEWVQRVSAHHLQQSSRI